jgi:hypothetical protein
MRWMIERGGGRRFSLRQVIDDLPVAQRLNLLKACAVQPGNALAQTDHFFGH